MERPVVGLPGRRAPGASVAGFPANLAHLDFDLYLADYARGILEAGGLALHLPLDLDPADAIEHLDAIVLPGGADVDPARYGAEPLTDAFPPEPLRDDYELGLLAAADRRGLPVLGICRGLQIINVARGGTLHQDVPPHSRYDLDPTVEVHDVAFEPGTIAHSLYGDRLPVNSLHHQTVDRLGTGLVVTGRAPDGTVETLESDDRRMLSVQWHPEMMLTRPQDPLFGWIVEAARAG